MSDLTGSTLGDYRIEALIGQGAIGQVFRGVHVYLGTSVALKVIDPRITSSPGFKTRFLQYATTIAGAAHPNVVKVYHCGEQDNRAYVVMELVSGGPLRAAQWEPARQGWRQSGWTAVGLIRQAANGLESVHARGVAHGDIKFSNLLLTTADLATAQVKVSDLGLLQVAGESGPSGGAAYRTRYPSDVLAGPDEDLFALGLLLYEMTTGRPPFGESAQRPSLGASDAALLGGLPAGVPEELTRVIVQCLGVHAGGRFSSCGELSKALDALLVAAASTSAAPVAAANPSRGPQAVRVVSNTFSQPVVTPKRRATAPRPPAPMAGGASKVPCLHAFDEAGIPMEVQYVRTTGISVGRSPANGLALESDGVSPTHARVDWDGRRVTVTDLGSSSGTLMQGQRLLPQVAQEWGADQWLQVGPYWLWLQLPSTDPIAANATEIMLDQQSKVMTITPGKPAACRLVLVNQKTQVDHVLLSVEGMPGEWVEGSKRDTQLQPFEKRDVTLTINVPRSPAGRAGEYSVTIRAMSSANPDAAPASVTATWTVLPFEAMGVSIAPARAGGRRQARYTVTLHHDGNRPAPYVLTGADEDKQLECLFTAESYVDRGRLQVNLEPGTKTNVKLKVAAPRRWFGSAQPYAFNVQAAPVDGQQALTTEAQFTHKPIFPIWMLVVAPVVIIGALVSAPPFLKPVVNTVYIEPRNPTVGQKVEVFWDAPKATRIRLLVNELPVLPDPDLAQGKYIFPEGFEKDTRLRILASNVFGEGAREVTATVKALPPPLPAASAVVEMFEVRPLTIAPDQEVTIKWRVSGAARVELNPLGSVAAEGSTTHSPPANQTFVLTAFNKDGVPTTRTLMVRVRNPTVSSPSALTLTASSPSAKTDEQGMVVGVGQMVIFKWEAANAQKVRIEGISPAALEGTSGQKTAQLKGEGTYTFTLVATNDKGQEFRSKPVEVRASCKSIPARVVTFRFGCNKSPEVQWK